MNGHPDPAEGEFGLADFVGEAVLLAGAGSAVMWQLARREVGLGVVEHSTTLDRPLDRLRTTLTYVYVMALGNEAERRAVASMVDRRHAPVRSAGRYSAFDPELQLWVAATLARTGETIRERVFGPMDPATRERVYRESWVLGTFLQVTPAMWPPTRAEFEEYWQASLALLAPGPRGPALCPATPLEPGCAAPGPAGPAPAEPRDPRQPRPPDAGRAGPAVDATGPDAVRPVLASRPSGLPAAPRGRAAASRPARAGGLSAPPALWPEGHLNAGRSGPTPFFTVASSAPFGAADSMGGG